ncbi:MAG: metallopeptidase family protein [Thermoguttaceae bacterium]
MIGPKKRAYFDRQVDRVVARLPNAVKKLLREVPVCVEDAPSRTVRREMKLRSPDELCGLFVGAVENRAVDQPQPPTVMLYRCGIFAVAADENGCVNAASLRRQIKITILHELGHYHGFDEDELREIGYG